MMGESQNRVNSLFWTARALVYPSVVLFIVIHSWELNTLLFIPSLLSVTKCARTVNFTIA